MNMQKEAEELLFFITNIKTNKRLEQNLPKRCKK